MALDREERLVAWMVGSIVCLLIVVLGCAFQSGRIDAHCKALGWTSGTLTITLDGYCTARTNQTDVVVPWKTAQAR